MFGVIDVKTCFSLLFFIIFIKRRASKVFFIFQNVLFSSGEFFYPTKSAKILLNLLNSCIKRLLGDGFNMAELYKNSLLKSRSP